MDEKEREKIGKQAQELLDKFGKAIESVKLKDKKGDSKVGGFRVEEQGKQGDKEFRRIMFQNAPAKDEDNIIAEKKQW